MARLGGLGVATPGALLPGGDEIGDANPTASDSGSGTDAGTVRIGGAADSGAGTDTATVKTIAVATDSATGTDLATVRVWTTESGAGTDSAAVKATEPSSDSGSGTDFAVPNTNGILVGSRVYYVASESRINQIAEDDRTFTITGG